MHTSVSYGAVAFWGKIVTGHVLYLALQYKYAVWCKSKDILFFRRDRQTHLVTTIHSAQENAESPRHSEIQAKTTK